MALRPLMIRQILTTERAHSTAPFFLDNEIQLENVGMARVCQRLVRDRLTDMVDHDRSTPHLKFL